MCAHLTLFAGPALSVAVAVWLEALVGCGPSLGVPQCPLHRGRLLCSLQAGFAAAVGDSSAFARSSHWASKEAYEDGAVCLSAPACSQAANVGDSSAFFIDPATGQSRELTEDHRLTNPRERQRLQDMGIQVGGHWP